MGCIIKLEDVASTPCRPNGAVKCHQLSQVLALTLHTRLQVSGKLSNLIMLDQSDARTTPMSNHKESLKSGHQPSKGRAGPCKPGEGDAGGQQVKQGWVWEGGVGQGCGAAPGEIPFPCRCLLQAQTYKPILPNSVHIARDRTHTKSSRPALLAALNHPPYIMEACPICHYHLLISIGNITAAVLMQTDWAG